LPEVSPNLAGAGIVPLLSRDAALQVGQNSEVIVLAALFGDASGHHDLSTTGFEQCVPKLTQQAGYAEAGLTHFGEFAARELVLATPEPPNVAKAFVLACLKGILPRSPEEGIGSGMRLRTFAAATDAFLLDLVHGWPDSNGAEQVALMVANYFASQIRSVSQLPQLANQINQILRSPNFDPFLDIFRAEHDRVTLAGSFEREVFRGDAFSIVAVDESSIAGFHPPTFCGLEDGKTLIDLAVVSRQELGWVSIFSGTPEAAKVDQQIGLLRLAQYLNDNPIEVNGQLVKSWGGNYNRLGWGAVRTSSSQECREAAWAVAKALLKFSASYSSFRKSLPRNNVF